MTRHSTDFEAEKALPADTIQKLAPSPSPAVDAGQTAAKPAKSGGFKRLLLTGAAVAVLAGASWYGWDYWTVGRFLVSTDDAYVKADNTTVAPKVSGYLHEVLVGDNERVRGGQVLARIDDRDFKVALDQAKADVAAAEAAIVSKQAQLDVQQAVINAAKATLDVDTANATFATQENKRYTDLAATGYGSVQNAQSAQSRNAGALAAIERDKANLASASKQVELLKAEIAQAVAAASRANALQHQAELNLSYATIIAPIDGVVGNRTLRAGQYVQAGTQLMSVVPASGAYVIANFKETQLTNVQAGQAVDIDVDMFPGKAGARPCRQPGARQRPGVCAAAAGQRHRQLHQGGAAHSGQDHAGFLECRASPGHVGDPDHSDAEARAGVGECAAARHPFQRGAARIAEVSQRRRRNERPKVMSCQTLHSRPLPGPLRAAALPRQ